MCQLAFRFCYLIDEHEKKNSCPQGTTCLKGSKYIDKQLTIQEDREWDVGVDGDM